MTIPTSEPILPDDEEPTPAPRGRRQRRIELNGEGQSDRRTALVEQSTPRLDFFLFLLVGSAVLGIALLIDSPALYLLAALFLPFLSPVVGISVASATGDGRHFVKSLAFTTVGAVILLAGGMLAGLATQWLPPALHEQAGFFTRFSWPYLAVLLVGAGLTAVILGRSPRVKPLIPNVALAYALFLPLGAAGFGLTSGLPGFWPDALMVFLVHLVVAALVASLVFMASGVRPAHPLGYAATAVFAVLTGIAFYLLGGFNQTTSTPVISAASTPTTAVAVSASPTPTLPAVTATRTPTPTNTLVPSLTPSQTITPQPTPIWAKVWSPEGNGGLIRKAPEAKAPIIGSLVNESPVQVLGEPVHGEGGPWVRILTEAGLEGWMKQDLLVTPTPAPGW